MNSINDYEIKESECSLALSKLKGQITISEWIGDHTELFDSIVYGPSELPMVADTHYEGNEFKGISDFFKVYTNLKTLITIVLNAKSS